LLRGSSGNQQRAIRAEALSDSDLMEFARLLGMDRFLGEKWLARRPWHSSRLKR
jgi:hypothetical protein